MAGVLGFLFDNILVTLFAASERLPSVPPQGRAKCCEEVAVFPRAIPPKKNRFI